MSSNGDQQKQPSKEVESKGQQKGAPANPPATPPQKRTQSMNDTKDGKIAIKRLEP